MTEELVLEPVEEAITAPSEKRPFLDIDLIGWFAPQIATRQANSNGDHNSNVAPDAFSSRRDPRDPEATVRQLNIEPKVNESGRRRSN